MARKMTMKQFERSPADKRAEKGKPEGSKGEMAADRKALSKINSKKGK